MKLFKTLIIFLAFAFTLIPSIADAACLRMTGNVSLIGSYWPLGGTVTVSCAGDIPPGPSNCVGDGPISLVPGQSFDFPNCSCLASPCLRVDAVPPGCTYLTTDACGVNGIPISPNVAIVCIPPSSSCGTDCSGNPSICNTASGGCTSCDSATNTCQPPAGPACGTNCAGNPSICNTASGGCTSCDSSTNTCQPPGGPTCGTNCAGNPSICNTASGGCTSCDSATNTCQPPGGPTCGTNCAGNPSICNTASGGCTSCNSTTNTCQPPGGPTCGTNCAGNPSICNTASGGCTSCNSTTNTCQPPSGGSCNGPCNIPSDCVARGGPTCQCLANTSGPGSSCQTPVVTGTSKCECDGMSSTAISAGGTVTVTAYTKASGTDASTWRLNNMFFRMFESPKGSVTIREIANSSASITQTINTPTLVRWMAVGSFTVPTDTTKEYRIQAVRDCRKLGTVVPDKKIEQLVLGRPVNNDKSILGQVKNLINNMLGISSYITVSTVQAQGDQLQLGTFLPSKTVINSCEFIRFAL